MREMETRNFWLQLVNDFYDSDRMLYLESCEHGQEYSLFYTKLLLKSVRTGGVLRLSEKLSYTDEMLAAFTRMSPEVVRGAMERLQLLDLVQIREDGTIFLPELEDMVGSESLWANRKRKYREKKPDDDMCETGVEDMEDNVRDKSTSSEDNVRDKNQNKEDNVLINKRKEKNSKINNSTEEKSKEKPAAGGTPSQPSAEPRKKFGAYGWIELTDAEYSALREELGEKELVRCIRYIDESAQSTGNKNGWKDWLLLLRRCSRESWGMKPARRQGDRAENETLAERYCAEDEPGSTSAAEDMARLRQYLEKLKKIEPQQGAYA